MDKFKLVLNIANKQTNLGFGLLALLTAGGEQVFSSTVFSCPCNELNFVYGLVFLLVPALALLLLGYILNKKTWKLLTGLCHSKTKWCRCKNLRSAWIILFQISTTAMVAPSSWIAVALLNGSYYECLMTGTNISVFQNLCGKDKARCENMHRFPCKDKSASEDRDQVLLTLKAQSQILGWLLIASIMLSSLLLNCLARCTSPISYLQLKFWKAYSQEETSMIEEYSAKHAKLLAQRNIESFFSSTPPPPVVTPSNEDWGKISALYKFTTKAQYYSTLHRCVEMYEETDNKMIEMGSILSSETADDHPAALQFVDDSAAIGI